jgi:hypothetical protein
MKSDNLETDEVEVEPIENEATKASDHDTSEDKASEVIFAKKKVWEKNSVFFSVKTRNAASGTISEFMN